MACQVLVLIHKHHACSCDKVMESKAKKRATQFYIKYINTTVLLGIYAISLNNNTRLN